jgi:hypothetical protein
MAKFSALEFIEDLGMIWLSYDMSLAGSCYFYWNHICYFLIAYEKGSRLNHFSALLEIERELWM